MFLLAPEEPYSSASPKIVVVQLQRGQTMIHSGLPAVQEEKYLLPIARGTGLRLWVFASTHEHLRQRDFQPLKTSLLLKTRYREILATENWSLKTSVITGV